MVISEGYMDVRVLHGHADMLFTVEQVPADDAFLQCQHKRDLPLLNCNVQDNATLLSSPSSALYIKMIFTKIETVTEFIVLQRSFPFRTANFNHQSLAKRVFEESKVDVNLVPQKATRRSLSVAQL